MVVGKQDVVGWSASSSRRHGSHGGEPCFESQPSHADLAGNEAYRCMPRRHGRRDK